MALISKNNRDWASVHVISFNKKDLVLGSVVKYGDGTYGMYVPKENFDLTYGEFGDGPKDLFLCYSDYRGRVERIDLGAYKDNLIYIDNNYQYDVIQVYYDIFPEKDITKDFVVNFTNEIQKYVRGRKYIKR